MNLLKLYFTHFGRISRATWFKRVCCQALICIAFGMLANYLLEGSAVIFSLLFLWSACALSVKRLHDINHSGWYLMLLLLPVIGPLYLLYLLLKKGNQKDNRFGSLQIKLSDYAQVNISR